MKVRILKSMPFDLKSLSCCASAPIASLSQMISFRCLAFRAIFRPRMNTRFECEILSAAPTCSRDLFYRIVFRPAFLAVCRPVLDVLRESYRSSTVLTCSCDHSLLVYPHNHGLFPITCHAYPLSSVLRTSAPGLFCASIITDLPRCVHHENEQKKAPAASPH